MEYYSVLNRFDARKRRISVFGRVSDINPEEMVITKFACSKRDIFNKKWSHIAYKIYSGIEKSKYADQFDIHPEIFKIKLENPATPKKEFLKFVNENYYRIRERVVIQNGNIVDVKRTNWHGKVGVNQISVKYLVK